MNIGERIEFKRWQVLPVLPSEPSESPSGHGVRSARGEDPRRSRLGAPIRSANDVSSVPRPVPHARTLPRTRTPRACSDVPSFEQP